MAREAAAAVAAAAAAVSASGEGASSGWGYLPGQWQAGAGAGAGAWMDMTWPTGERVLGESAWRAWADAGAAAGLCAAAALARLARRRSRAGDCRVAHGGGGEDSCGRSSGGGICRGPGRLPDGRGDSDGSCGAERIGENDWIWVTEEGRARAPCRALCQALCHAAAGVVAVWCGQVDLYCLLWAGSLSALGIALRPPPGPGARPRLMDRDAVAVTPAEQSGPGPG